MAKIKTISVAPDFDLNETVMKIVELYQQKGFEVNAMPLGSGASIDFRKDDDGIKKFAGLSIGLKANMTVNNGTLCIDYEDEDWMIKGIVLGVSFFLVALCIGLVPIITSAIGLVNQSGLSKKIGNDIQMIVGSNSQGGANPFAQPSGK